jgi:hypothetical protein
MGLMTTGRSGAPLSWHCRDLTIAEMLSDSLVQTLMKADRVDPQALQAELRSVGLQIELRRRQEQAG